MQIESDSIVTITEINQNFSRIARIADEKGEVVIFKNNKPKYKLISIEKAGEQKRGDENKHGKHTE